MRRFIPFSFFIFFIVQSIYPQANITVQVTDFEFTPKNITITVGDTVTFKWVKGSHTTTSDSTSGANSWNSPMNSSNPVFKKVITSPGLHRYYCIPHGGPGGVGMSGTIQANAKVTFVKEKGSSITYELRQNYPNPFNPSTKIDYSIPANSFVSLKVFNAIGEQIASLVNEFQAEGNYSVTFNAGNLPSGIYFYRLNAGNYSQVKKMTIVR